MKTSKEDLQTTIKSLAALACMYNQEMSAGVLAEWAATFQREGLSPDNVKTACRSAMQEGGAFMPTLPQLLKLGRGEPGAKVEAIEAWDKVMDLLVTKGSAWMGRNMEMSRAMNSAIRSVGGVEALGLTEYDAIGYKQKTFLDTYQAIAKDEKLKELAEAKSQKLISD